jgi:TolA-binding protein
MTEHQDREAHEAKADEVERELDDMQERSERLGDDIESTQEDWERRKRDESVPGATGELDADDDADDSEVDADELDFGRDIDADAVVAEDGPPAEDGDED